MAKRTLAIALTTAGFAVSGVALPVAAVAAPHAATVSHKHHPVKKAPCGGKVVGIDVALGSTNICIPL